MTDVSISILGLNRVGASVGLALKRYNDRDEEHTFTVTGYDTIGKVRRDVQNDFDFVHQVKHRIDESIRGQNIVLVTMPYHEIEEMYDLIGVYAEPGTVVIDMSAAKARAVELAKEHFKDGVHLICTMPLINPRYIFNGLDELPRASADYFDDSTMLLMPSVSADKAAINLATDFTRILGAEVMYLEASEHDALSAATEALPMLLGVAYFRMMANSPGWDDSQRLTGASFGMLTHHLFDTHPNDMPQLWADLKPALLRNLDAFLAELGQLRDFIAEDDKEALDSTTEHLSKEYEVWANRRYSNRWQYDERMDDKSPQFGSIVNNLMGSFIPRRNKDDKDDKK